MFLEEHLHIPFNNKECYVDVASFFKEEVSLLPFGDGDILTDLVEELLVIVLEDVILLKLMGIGLFRELHNPSPSAE